MVTGDGNPLQPAITIPANALSVSVGSDATVSVAVPGQTASQYLGAHDPLPLQPFKDVVQHAIPGPPIHARVDGVPVAKTLPQPAPLASLLGHVQQRIEHLQVGKADMASLPRKAGLDTKILSLGDFYEPKHIAKF
jgi:hypothetical protein